MSKVNDWRELLVQEMKEDVEDDLLNPEQDYGDMIDILSGNDESFEETANRMIGSGDDDSNIDQEDENIDQIELESFKDNFLDTGSILNGL